MTTETLATATETPVPSSDAATPTEQSAEALFGRGGEVPVTYQSAIDSVFNALEYDARYYKDDEAIQGLTEDRREIGAFLQEYQVAEPVAREVLSLANRYLEREISAEAMSARKEMAMGELKERYGADLEKSLNGARRVVLEASKRLPWLVEVLECGGGNDPKLIAHFVTIAKQRGWA